MISDAPPLVPFADYKALADACVDTPTDWTPRLVLADFLDERGDPRGPLLRLTHAARSVDNPFPIARTVTAGYKHPAGFVWHTDTFRDLFIRGGRRTGHRGGWARLFGFVCLYDALDRFGTDPGRGWTYFSSRSQQLVARYELYACRVVDARFRDAAGRMYGAGSNSIGSFADRALVRTIDACGFPGRGGPAGAATLTIALAFHAPFAPRDDGRTINVYYGSNLADRFHWLCDRFVKVYLESGFDPGRLRAAERAVKAAAYAARPDPGSRKRRGR